MFGANGGRSNPKKGWEDFVKVIPYLPHTIKNNIEVNIFGESNQAYVENGVCVNFIGCCNTIGQLRDVYHNAEVLVLPSKEDNAPNVKFEAWLCGLPVIAFNRTGCAEYIKPLDNGWIADDGDYVPFAQGIEKFYNIYTQNQYKVLRQKIADESRKEFCAISVVDKMCKVYEKVINEKDN